MAVRGGTRVAYVPFLFLSREKTKQILFLSSFRPLLLAYVHLDGSESIDMGPDSLLEEHKTDGMVSNNLHEIH